MRFRRITLDHFRGVDSATIEFGDAVTIVEGPNEVGKSTLAEAITVLFDHLDSSRRQEVRAVHQIGADVGPYVELTLTVGEYEITYAKRFLRKPSTLLRIDAPEPEQHAGREAHERMATILKETVDDALWAAMRVAQGASLQQPDLADVGALRAALDVDGSGHRSAADSDAELMSRVADEYTRYFTPRTGQPTGELSAAVAAHTRARETYDAVTADLDVVDSHVRRYAAVENELDGLGAQEGEHAARLKELTAQERALAALRETDAEARASVEAAESAVDTARHAITQRAALADEAARRRAATEDLAGEVGRLGEHADRARAAADEARETVRAAREVAHRCERAHRDATDMLHAVRLRRDADDLDERVSRAGAARERVLAAESVLSSADVDDDTLERLVALDGDVRTAHKLLRAGAASVEVEPLGAGDVLVDGAAPAAGRRSVLGTTTVEAPGVVRVTVRPGSAGSDLEEQVRAAEQARAAALSDAGVRDLTAARDAVSARRDAETERDLARDRLRHALGEADDFDALAARARGVRERHDQILARLSQRPTDGAAPAIPVDADAAEVATDVARETYDDAATEATGLERAAEESERSAAEARESLVRAEQRHESDVDELRRLERRLADERSATADAALSDSLVAAQHRIAAAAGERERSAAALAAAKPEELSLRTDNARGVTDRLTRARRELEDEQQQISGRLEAFASRGLHDQQESATAALEHAEDALSRVEARADAARLLHDTLQRHRDTARQRYVAPYKRAVESLGRVVFGDDLAVEIADDLTIVSRTSAGRTVAFDALSGGAREQLAILGRLAAASLVDPADGAPLVLDDALGHADPDRLDRLAAVLNQAGRVTQIIVLTCHPERFRAVGSAETVRLGHGS